MDTDEIQQQLPKDIEDFIGNNHESYKRAFKENDRIWHCVPLLNYTPLNILKDQCLIRFRGLIQDIRHSEYYLEHYFVYNANGTKSQLQCGKYRDGVVLKKNETINYDSNDKNIYGERYILYAISIPALNEWCIEYEKSINEKVPPHYYKKIDEAKSFGTDVNTNGKVESMDTTENMMPYGNYVKNFPIPERPGIACIVVLYEDLDKYSLNDMIDVIGFLSINDTAEATDFHGGAAHPPLTVVPRIHAIAVNRLSHFNPLIDKRLQQHCTINYLADGEIIYTELHTFLKLCCFNDDVAANYILCHLMSKIYGRADEVIGKFCVNLWNFPKEMDKQYTKNLYDILSLIIPMSHYVPLTLENVNTIKFIPKKNYEDETLLPGLLQLGRHSHLILDETRMQQGTLGAQGVQNLQHLARLINDQKIKCDFEYYTLGYDVDIPVLIFSEGRSMLPCDISLPLNVDEKFTKIAAESMTAAHHYLTQNNRLHRFRCYLTQNKMVNFTVDQPSMEMINNDYVNMRKENSCINPEDLHHLLVLTRLLTISRGKCKFDAEFWNFAKNMELKRKERLCNFAKQQCGNPVF